MKNQMKTKEKNFIKFLEKLNADQIILCIEDKKFIKHFVKHYFALSKTTKIRVCRHGKGLKPIYTKWENLSFQEKNTMSLNSKVYLTKSFRRTKKTRILSFQY